MVKVCDVYPTEKTFMHWLAQIKGFCRIKTGQYTGDGETSKDVALPFDPEFVRIWIDGAAGAGKAVFEATKDFSSGVSSKDLDGDTDLVDNCLIALGTKKFTVDDAGADADPNTDTQVYNYLALGGTR